MADNITIKNSTGATVSAATDDLSDSSQSPKVTLLDGTGSPTPISPPIKGQFPTTIGPKAASASMSVTLSTDDDLLIGSVTETAPASDTASSGLNGRLQRIAQRLTSLIALIPAALGQGTMAQSMRVVIASDQSAIKADHTSTGIGSGVTTVTTAGTDVVLAGSTAAKWVIVQAQTDNTGLIAVGASGVDATIATGTGVALSAGQSISLPVDNLADVYIDATVSTDGVRYTYGT